MIDSRLDAGHAQSNGSAPLYPGRSPGRNRNSRFHEILDEGDRQRLVQRELDRAFGYLEPRELVLEHFDSRTGREQAAVIVERGGPDDDAGASERGHAVADDFRRVPPPRP